MDARRIFSTHGSGDRRVGMAAPARAKAGGAGVGRRVEEGDAIAARPAARARGPAVDAGRSDGVHEQAVGAPVAGEDGLPAGRVVQLLAGLVVSRRGGNVVHGLDRTSPDLTLTGDPALAGP